MARSFAPTAHETPGKPGTGALCLMSRSPHRVSDGWSIRCWHLVEALCELVDEVHVVFFGTPEDAAECRQALCGPGALVHAVPPPPPYRPWALLKGLFFPTPFNMHNLWSRDMAALLRDLSGRVAFDLVQIEDVCMAQYERFIRRPRDKGRTRVLKALDMHNVDSQLMARYGDQETNLSKALYAKLTAAKLKACERALCATFDAVLVCSGQDADQLSRHTDPRRLHVIPNGVHRGYFAPMEGSPGTDTLVFTGSLDYHANVSGLLWFLDEVFPLVKAARPGVRFRIVGKNPVQTLIQAAQRTPGVTLHASVPDVRPYLREADVVVVPLLVGGGTRLKILEALSAGRPVVSTSLGSEGIAVRHGRDILQADTATAFADAVLGVLGDENLQQSLVEAGFKTVEAYDWRTIGADLRTVYANLGLGPDHARRPAASA